MPDGAVCLARIFDHIHSTALAYGGDGIDVAHPSKKMNRNYRSSSRRHARGNSVRNNGATFITVDENWARSERQDGAHSRYEGIGLGDDLVASADVNRAWTLGLAGSVSFYGYLEKSLRNNLLARAWLTVCPSAFEGYGVVCVEANSWGLPVVAANVPGLRDSVRDGATGVLVPHGNPARLATEISGLIDDPVRRAAMGSAGRSWAAAHDWQRSAKSFLEVVGAQVPVAAGAEPVPQLSALAG